MAREMKRFPHLEEAVKAADDLVTATAQASTTIRRALAAGLRDLCGDWLNPEVAATLRRLDAKLAQEQKMLKDAGHAVDDFVNAVKTFSEMRDLLLREGEAQDHGL